MEQLKSAAIAAAVLSIPVILAAVVGLIRAALAALTRKLEAEAHGSKMAAVGERLAVFASTTVQQLEQEMRPSLVAATADGVLTQVEGQKLKEEAMTRLKAMLGDEGLKELQAVLGIAAGGLGTFLGGVIEGAVTKMQAGAVPSPSPS